MLSVLYADTMCLCMLFIHLFISIVSFRYYHLSFQLVGIITRHDLAHHKLHHLIEEKKHKKEK